MRDIDNEERCPECDTIGHRYISQSQSFSGADDWDTAHFSHALGKVVKTNKEERKLARAKGLVEIGTESSEKIEKHFSSQRKKKYNDSWGELNMDHGNIRSK